MMSDTPTTSTTDDPLFAPTRLPAEVCKRDPLIVVGLPRSGSSFLSHILSQLPDWYVFDDLYIHRRANELQVQTPLTPEDLEKLVHFMGWQIRARTRFGLYAIPNVTEDEVSDMDAALVQAFTDTPGSWAELQEDWMRRLATRADCTQWGYKMPGAFRQIPALLQHYPQARFMFIMRNPYKVLASYKHMPKDHHDGDRRRYHPLAYAYYWRMAVRSYLAQRDRLGNRLMLVQFEDLVGTPQETAERIATFLDVPAPAQVHVPEKPNTSFDKPRAAARLTGLETWLVNIIAQRELQALGYAPEKPAFKLSDMTDFAAITGRFGWYQARLILRKIQIKLGMNVKPLTR